MELMDIITSVQEKKARSGYGALTQVERVVWTVSTLEAEVNNGC